MLKQLYCTFLEERRFLKNCSPKTLRSYRQAWKAFEPYLIGVTHQDQIRVAMKAGVVEKMNGGTLKPSSVNVYLRALNAFVRWGSIEDHFKPPIKSLSLLKTPTKIVPILSETQIQHLVHFKPKHLRDRRVHAMALVILDTGLRLNECLQLQVADVDLGSFLVTVLKGKGDKQRKVPISAVGRKVLYRYISQVGTAHAIDLSEIIVDAGESARNLRRPGMERLLRMVDAREVKGVVIASLSRLTRSVSDLALLLDRFRRHNVTLISVQESLDTGSAAGRLVMNIKFCRRFAGVEKA